ncbi:hypothetical protein DIZ81_07605 [Legionella taurinensis]|nr:MULTISPECIES: hypothetical protein [Legionella]HAT2081789.1 hypothetical protein [Legionella pneumophila]MDX1837578.1 hypothetical protein [Legionella taurinensis]PUT39877.1 hypothetical protein DB744_07605 [Legionella taurinensis]PUT43643.1 hypothetical protein DB746_04930 [Legionella taurinensis]PUT46224.1 hypothetical protein DB743_05820 [Legionella taurinensis]
MDDSFFNHPGETSLMGWFSQFLEKIMENVSSIISRKEYVFFDLACCINEFHTLRDELSAQDIEEIKRLSKKLHSLLEDQHPRLNLV